MLAVDASYCVAAVLRSVLLPYHAEQLVAFIFCSLSHRASGQAAVSNDVYPADTLHANLLRLADVNVNFHTLRYQTQSLISLKR